MKVRLNEPTFGEEEIEAAVEVMRSTYVTQGKKVKEFEQAVASYCGAKYALAVCNGTAALHCACHTLGIGEGDEVIIPLEDIRGRFNVERYEHIVLGHAVL